MGSRWVSPAEVVYPASVGRVVAASPEQLRAGLLSGDAAVVPQIELTAPVSDNGQPLEWRYRLNGGAWRAARVLAGVVVVQDDGLFIQGDHQLSMRARRVGSRLEWSTTVDLTVRVDSAPPFLFSSQVGLDP